MKNLISSLNVSFFDYFFNKSSKNDIMRQIISLVIVITFGFYLIYFISGYFFIFLQNNFFEKPKYHEKIQIIEEIKQSLRTFPILLALFLPIFLGEVRGFSKLYTSKNKDLNIIAFIFQTVSFIVFTDANFYWSHRFLHLPFIYEKVHKCHHRWKTPSPFASHAISPLDGFFQFILLHIYIYIFPVEENVYMMLMGVYNFLGPFIHMSGEFTKKFKKIPHSIHHLNPHSNFGSYTIFWDKICGTDKNIAVL